MKLNRLTRIVGIYFSLAYICVGSILVGIFVIPTIALFRLKYPEPESSRKIISRSIRFYLKSLSLFKLIDFKPDGLSQYQNKGPFILISNHQSLFDILFFISNFPTCCCIVKPALAFFSPYSAVIYWARYIVNKGDGSVISAALSELEAERSLVIFPEGTRLSAELQAAGNSDVSTLLPFHRGAAALSVRSRIPILPISFTYDPPALGKGFKWHHLPNKICKISMKADELISPPSGKEVGILSREFTVELEERFKKILA